MKQLVPALFAVGAIMALTGAAVYITGWNYAPYIYTIGAGFIALAQVNTPPAVTNGLPVLLLPPYSNFTLLSAFHRKKQKKRNKKSLFKASQS